MKNAHEPTRLGRLLTVLLTVSLVLFAISYVLLFVIQNVAASWAMVVLAVQVPLNAVIWLGLFFHVVGIFLRRPASAGDVWIGLTEGLLLCCLTPEVFTTWQAFTEDPGLLFSMLRQPLYFRFWTLARMISVLTLLVKYVGPRWLQQAPKAPLTLEEVAGQAFNIPSENGEDPSH